MKKLFIFLLSIIALSVGNAFTLQAAEPGEKILTFDSTIHIDKNSTAKVTEEITYDFGESERHGIYRDIPIDYKDGKDTYYVTADYIGATDQNGKSVEADTDSSNGNYRIILGDPDRTIRGVHTYKITYELSPIISKNDGRPFLNIDAIGTGWQVPIENAKVEIALDEGAELTNAKCFYGAQGSTQSCLDTEEGSLNTRMYTAVNLSAYQGVSINADVPEGYTSEYLIANKQRPGDVMAMIIGITLTSILGLGVVVGFGIAMIRWWRIRAKRKKQIVVAQYDPPATLNPAEIGYLADDTSDMTEVTATLIDLAVRGYVKITQQEKIGLSSVFGGNDYMLTALKPAEDLSSNEKVLWVAFFSKGQEVQLSKLDKTATAAAIATFHANIKTSLEKKGFYSQAGGILEKGTLTDQGAQEWGLVEGFKLFLNVVEKDRLAFSDAPEKTPERFNRLLPAAIALGVEKKWAKQFEGIDIAPATTWYAGANIAAFSALALTHDLSSGFANTVSTNSSISSSGGSSGGGVGGGGGGSW